MGFACVASSGWLFLVENTGMTGLKVKIDN